MSKKSMRRSPTSRNERREAIMAKIMQPPYDYLGYPRSVYTGAHGAGGACPKHGVYDRFVCPGCKEEREACR